MNIRYLKNKDIDKECWDNVIDQSINGRIYGYSWFLDSLADDWDALIMGDYEVIMPLPRKSKFGLSYIITPYFTQKLNLYSKENINSDLYIQFIEKIPFKFRYINLSLDIKNVNINHKYETKVRTNFVLDIDRPYEEIKKGYSKNAYRILKEKQPELNFTQTDEIWEIIDNFRKLKGRLSMESYQRLYKAALEAKNKNKLLAYYLSGEDKKEILASYLFFISHDRAYYLIGTQTEIGRIKHAAYFSFDSFFKLHHQKIKIFDFEGSDIPGVATFFKKWGSVPEYYSNIQVKRFPVSLLKF